MCHNYHGREYVFTQPICHGQDPTQGQFLTGVQLVWIQGFPSRPVAIPRLKFALVFTDSLREGKKDGFIPFLKVLAQSKTQTISLHINTLDRDSNMTSKQKSSCLL